ncbi:MAG: sigma-70 family RNA polymerase sigma factor [Actinomycetota bacterium]
MEQTLAAPASEAPGAADIAFEQLYRSSRDDVFAYAAGLLRNRSAAEEVTATAFERAFRKRHRFDPRRGNPRAWLFGIARNAALDELRRGKRQAELTEEAQDVDSPSPGHLAEESSRRATVRAALAGLDSRERELVALKFFAGLSNSEIAGLLGVSESNAGTRLHRVITKLREACR